MDTADAKLHYRVHGLDCAEEIAVLKQAVGPVVGGEENLSFDLVNARMTVLAQDKHLDRSDAILAAVKKAGFRGESWTEDSSRTTIWERRGRLITTGSSGALVVAGLAFEYRLLGVSANASGLATHEPPAGAIACYLLAVVLGAWFVIPRAWLAAKRLRPDMNLLMTVAVVGAIGIGEWFEAAAVVFLFSLSLTLESWSIARARRAVERLMELAPNRARRLLPDGREEEVRPDQINVGDRVLVKPGERIPVDGSVTAGAGAVDQSPVTGESIPVEKSPGDTVFAGTINGDGALDVACDKPASDSTVARIIRMVAEAHSSRAPSEQWVDRFARIYTPAVIALALAVVVLPPITLGDDWGLWFYRALVLLVIACPCALVIATPVSIVAALASAARRGVLVKGGAHIETPARLDVVAFDKTGTLTRGRPIVVDVVPLRDHNEKQLLGRAAALEARSEHPLARAIVARAKETGIAFEPAESFRSIKGRGALGRVQGREFWLGSHRYLEERGQDTDDVHDRIESMSAAGRTVVVVGNEDHVCGLIAIADAIRPDAPAALQELRALGVHRFVMLTGDNMGTARSIASQLGIDDVRAELLPEDKVEAIADLVSIGAVAMVGDGVNDAPALARSSLSIAMGAAGSDVALETADAALMSDDLMALPWLVRHSQRTLRTIHQNIGFALLVKAAFVVLTVLGHASLWAAIAADTGASLLVIFNALRLLRVRSQVARNP